MDTETWGLCGCCDRWFYCPAWFDKEAPQPLCPICGSEPVAIEQRSGGTPTSAFRPQTRLPREPAEHQVITGLCPKCGAWFACDAWFDNSVPLPCCPSCHLAPVKIDCQTPSGTLTISVDVEQ